MKVKILQDVIIAYGPSRLFMGDTVELPEGVAQPLVIAGQAIELKPEASPKKGKGKASASKKKENIK